MLIDSGEVRDTDTLEAPICVIGSGAAGLTLAQSFEKKGISCIVLEAGGDTPTAKSQAVYSGSDDGLLLSRSPDHLQTSRLRYLGGTTNHWTGWCAEYDEADFLKRAWLPMSGWPIQKKDISPFYKEARQICDIRGGKFESKIADFSMVAATPFATQFFELSPPTRFAEKYKPLVKRSKHIRLILNSYVTQIVVKDQSSQIEYVEVSRLDKKKFKVKAQLFVLATGGFENARLLLASNSVRKKGLGNSGDSVGRYYMDHPEIDLSLSLSRSMGQFYESQSANQWQALQKTGRAIYPAYVPLPELRKQHKLLNSAFLIRSSNDSLEAPVFTVEKSQKEKLSVLMKCEQAAHRESRVKLSMARDEWGVPRLHRHFYLGNDSVESIKSSVELFARALGQKGLGRIRKVFDKDDKWTEEAKIWGHPLGTTRMSEGPTDGVVNRDCRVHDVKNLFIAGSSVFSTAGYVNPTLTIVAMALRLAEHLGSQFSKGEVG